jgi:hypothetical protein
VFGLTHFDSIPVGKFRNFGEIHQYMSQNGRVFIFMGEGKHKIKKKAEQIACDEAIKQLLNY